MKIAILFSGIGYNYDKPLLYYAGKICSHYQYESVRVAYSSLPKNITKAFPEAYAQAEAYLENIQWNEYDDILFISKSIGTAVAAAYAQNHKIACRNIYYTPLAQTFDFAPQAGIVFHGTSDPWAETAVIEEKCRQWHLPLHIIDNTNHSLELCSNHCTVLQNIRIVENVMKLSEQYIAHGIFYRTLQADEICRELFRDFIRHQNVEKCLRKENGAWVVQDAPFVDHWSESDYQFLIDCLKNTLRTGGLVYGSFCAQPYAEDVCRRSGACTLKGFVSVESTLFGGAQGYLDLSSIHVSEDMRGKGIGKTLFHTAKDWARKKDAKKLYISSHSAIETQAFYKAMGCVDAQVYDQRHVAQEPYDRQLECLV